MKRILYTLSLLCALDFAVFGQGAAPLTVQEADGSPKKAGVTKIIVTNGTLTISGTTATIVTGGGGGGGTPGGSTTQVQYNDTGAFAGAAGFTFNGTSTITLGVAGTSVGAVAFKNATSGTITLSPVTGALGTVTLSLPAATDTLVGLAATQTLTNKTLTAPVISTISNTGTLTLPTSTDTLVGKATADTFTNKTLTSSTNVLGGVTMTLGSDADGDIYYRSSNVLTRLPKGTAGQVLTMNGGATAPEWAAGGGGGGITVGTTTITSGTTTRVLYNNAGVVGEYAVTGTGNAVLSAAPTLTGRVSAADGLFATTVTTGTGATAGLQVTANSLTTGNGAELSSSSVTSGNVVSIAATGTVAASNTKTALNVATSGANATSTQTTYGAQISNTSTGTSSTNIALNLSASGGATNIALNVAAGQIATPAGSQAAPALRMGSTYGFYNNGGAWNRVVGFLGLDNQYLGLISSAEVSWASGSDPTVGGDTIIRRRGAANLAFGAADAASPVAQTLSVQNVVGGTTNTAGATWTRQGSLGTSQGAPGRQHFTGGAMIAASGTTQQTAIDRFIVGATKVLTNNSAITITNVTAAAGTSAGGNLDYCVEVTDGTDTQYECGSVTYGVSNKAGVFSGNTATKFGNHQNATSGTLAVTFAISGANPALLSVNANSSLSPSTGYPRIVYNLRNLGNQAVAIQ